MVLPLLLKFQQFFQILEKLFRLEKIDFLKVHRGSNIYDYIYDNNIWFIEKQHNFWEHFTNIKTEINISVRP